MHGLDAKASSRCRAVRRRRDGRGDPRDRIRGPPPGRARQHAGRQPPPTTSDAPADVVAPSRDDPVVRAASPVIGGPAGRRLASATGIWRATSILVALSAVMLALGVVEKQHCREQGWTTPDQFWHACYTDIPVLFGSASLGGPDRATLGEATGPAGLGQPPLASAAMWLVSAVVPDDAQNPARSFFDTSTIVLVILLAVGVTAISAGRRPAALRRRPPRARRRSWSRPG